MGRSEKPLYVIYIYQHQYLQEKDNSGRQVIEGQYFLIVHEGGADSTLLACFSA